MSPTQVLSPQRRFAFPSLPDIISSVKRIFYVDERVRASVSIYAHYSIRVLQRTHLRIRNIMRFTRCLNLIASEKLRSEIEVKIFL